MRPSPARLAPLLLLAAPHVGQAAAPPAPTDRASLCAALDRDLADLLPADPNREAVREAAQLLAGTNQNSRWTDGLTAAALLRQHRSLAAVPLLMRYLVEHAGLSTSHVMVPAYVDAIQMLTGERIDVPAAQGRDRRAAVEAAVLKLYLDWWQPNRARLTTDIGRMSDDQVAFLVDELERHAGREMGQGKGSADRGTSARQQFERLSSVMESTGTRAEWYPEESHRRMAPLLLAGAGFPGHAGDVVTDGDAPVRFAVVPLLAALWRSGQARAVDAVAADPKQNDATRLTCMLVRRAAGQDPDARALLSILDGDHRPDCRVVSLLLLGRSGGTPDVVPRLVDALDDSNQEVRAAALDSLRTAAPAAAVPKVIRVVRANDPPDLVPPALRLLGDVGGDEAAGAIADYIGAEPARGSARHSGLGRALIAFSDATGRRWTEAGAHPPAYYADRAAAALAWWKDHRQ